MVTYERLSYFIFLEANLQINAAFNNYEVVLKVYIPQICEEHA